MKVSYLLIILFLVLDPVIKLKKTKLGDFATAKIPTNFILMNDDQMADKYPASHKPLAVYTNDNTTVDICYTLQNCFWTQQDMKVLKQFYKSSIIQLYDSVVFYKNEIITIRKKDYLIMNFKTIKKVRVYDGSKMNVEMYVSQKYIVDYGQLFIFSFYCPYSVRKDWLTISEKIINSFRIK